MKLRWAAGSPYVRKVMVTAYETGLEARIEIPYRTEPALT